jgi:hypothetical protein
MHGRNVQSTTLPRFMSVVEFTFCIVLLVTTGFLDWAMPLPLMAITSKNDFLRLFLSQQTLPKTMGARTLD